MSSISEDDRYCDYARLIRGFHVPELVGLQPLQDMPHKEDPRYQLLLNEYLEIERSRPLVDPGPQNFVEPTGDYIKPELLFIPPYRGQLPTARANIPNTRDPRLIEACLRAGHLREDIEPGTLFMHLEEEDESNPVLVIDYTEWPDTVSSQIEVWPHECNVLRVSQMDFENGPVSSFIADDDCVVEGVVGSKNDIYLNEPMDLVEESDASVVESPLNESIDILESKDVKSQFYSADSDYDKPMLGLELDDDSEIKVEVIIPRNKSTSTSQKKTAWRRLVPRVDEDNVPIVDLSDDEPMPVSNQSTRINSSQINDMDGCITIDDNEDDDNYDYEDDFLGDDDMMRNVNNVVKLKNENVTKPTSPRRMSVFPDSDFELVGELSPQGSRTSADKIPFLDEAFPADTPPITPTEEQRSLYPSVHFDKRQTELLTNSFDKLKSFLFDKQGEPFDLDQVINGLNSNGHGKNNGSQYNNVHDFEIASMTQDEILTNSFSKYGTSMYTQNGKNCDLAEFKQAVQDHISQQSNKPSRKRKRKKKNKKGSIEERKRAKYLSEIESLWDNEEKNATCSRLTEVIDCDKNQSDKCHSDSYTSSAERRRDRNGFPEGSNQDIAQRVSSEVVASDQNSSEPPWPDALSNRLKRLRSSSTGSNTNFQSSYEPALPIDVINKRRNSTNSSTSGQSLNNSGSSQIDPDNFNIVNTYFASFPSPPKIFYQGYFNRNCLDVIKRPLSVYSRGKNSSLSKQKKLTLEYSFNFEWKFQIIILQHPLVSAIKFLIESNRRMKFFAVDRERSWCEEQQRTILSIEKTSEDCTSECGRYISSRVEQKKVFNNDDNILCLDKFEHKKENNSLSINQIKKYHKLPTIIAPRKQLSAKKFNSDNSKSHNSNWSVSFAKTTSSSEVLDKYLKGDDEVPQLIDNLEYSPVREKPVIKQIENNLLKGLSTSLKSKVKRKSSTSIEEKSYKIPKKENLKKNENIIAEKQSKILPINIEFDEKNKPNDDHKKVLPINRGDKILVLSEKDIPAKIVDDEPDLSFLSKIDDKNVHKPYNLQDKEKSPESFLESCESLDYEPDSDYFYKIEDDQEVFAKKGANCTNMLLPKDKEVKNDLPPTLFSENKKVTEVTKTSKIEEKKLISNVSPAPPVENKIAPSDVKNSMLKFKEVNNVASPVFSENKVTHEITNVSKIKEKKLNRMWPRNLSPINKKAPNVIKISKIEELKLNINIWPTPHVENKKATSVEKISTFKGKEVNKILSPVPSSENKNASEVTKTSKIEEIIENVLLPAASVDNKKVFKVSKVEDKKENKSPLSSSENKNANGVTKISTIEEMKLDKNVCSAAPCVENKKATEVTKTSKIEEKKLHSALPLDVPSPENKATNVVIITRIKKKRANKVSSSAPSSENKTATSVTNKERIVFRCFPPYENEEASDATKITMFEGKEKEKEIETLPSIPSPENQPRIAQEEVTNVLLPIFPSEKNKPAEATNTLRLEETVNSNFNLASFSENKKETDATCIFRIQEKEICNISPISSPENKNTSDATKITRFEEKKKEIETLPSIPSPENEPKIAQEEKESKNNVSSPIPSPDSTELLDGYQEGDCADLDYARYLQGKNCDECDYYTADDDDKDTCYNLKAKDNKNEVTIIHDCINLELEEEREQEEEAKKENEMKDELKIVPEKINKEPLHNIVNDPNNDYDSDLITFVNSLVCPEMTSDDFAVLEDSIENLIPLDSPTIPKKHFSDVNDADIINNFKLYLNETSESDQGTQLPTCGSTEENLVKNLLPSLLENKYIQPSATEPIKNIKLLNFLGKFNLQIDDDKLKEFNINFIDIDCINVLPENTLAEKNVSNASNTCQLNDAPIILKLRNINELMKNPGNINKLSKSGFTDSQAPKVLNSNVSFLNPLENAKNNFIQNPIVNFCKMPNSTPVLQKLLQNSNAQSTSNGKPKKILASSLFSEDISNPKSPSSVDKKDIFSYYYEKLGSSFKEKVHLPEPFNIVNNDTVNNVKTKLTNYIKMLLEKLEEFLKNFKDKKCNKYLSNLIRYKTLTEETWKVQTSVVTVVQCIQAFCSIHNETEENDVYKYLSVNLNAPESNLKNIKKVYDILKEKGICPDIMKKCPLLCELEEAMLKNIPKSKTKQKNCKDLISNFEDLIKQQIEIYNEIINFRPCFECKQKSIIICVKCKKASYCSEECQAKNWKEHHKKCKNTDVALISTN